MKKTNLFLYVSTLFSGAAALVYEILWTRALSLYIGSTVESSSVVFSSFVLGLSFGTYYFSKKSSTYKNILSRVAFIEILIGIVSSGLGIGLFYFSEIFQYYGDHFFQNQLVIVITTFLLVLVPTFLMGGVFPLLIEYIRRLKADESVASNIYGFNILGASIGVLGAVFFILPKTGVLEAFAFGVFMNFLSAFFAFYLNKMQRVDQNTPKNFSEVVPTAGSKIFEFKNALKISFLSGFFIFLQEITWARLSSLFIGNRVFATSVLLIVILVYLFLGSLISKGIFQKFKRDSTPYVILCVSSMGALLSLCFFQFFISYKLNASGALAVLTVLFATFVILAPVFLPLSTLFPYILQKVYSENKETSQYLGAFYIWNATASVIGALTAAYLLSPFVGSVKTLISAAFLMFFISVCFLFLKAFQKKYKLLLSLFCGFFLLLATSLSLDYSFVRRGEKLLYQNEDKYGLFQVVKSSNGITYVRNNFTKLIDGLEFLNTSYAQQMQAHLGLYFNSHAEKALIIGSGYGITAGVFGLYDQIKKVDVVEILPEILKQTDRFADFNFKAQSNDKIDFIQGDGRQFLVKSKSKYDIISVNISDPALPGCSSFFYDQFYQVVKSKLSKDGVYLVHVFGTNYKDIISVLQKSFKHVRFFTSYNDCTAYKCYNVVATDSDKGLIGQKNELNPKTEKSLKLIQIQELEENIKMSEVYFDAKNMNNTRHLSEFYPGIEFLIEPHRSLFWSNQ